MSERVINGELVPGWFGPKGHEKTYDHCIS